MRLIDSLHETALPNVPLIHIRKSCLSDLQKKANGNRALYEPGAWTGILNALDENSPHCVQSVEEIGDWYLRGLEYLFELESKPRSQQSGKVPKPFQDALDELEALLQRKDITLVEFAECTQAIVNILA